MIRSRKVYAAKAILKAVGKSGRNIRRGFLPDLRTPAHQPYRHCQEVEQRCQSIRGKKMKVAVMGCVVNGPGEAREADLGIAGGDGVGLIFRRGEIIKKVPQEQLVDALMDEIAQYEGE
ncbi:MAG: flavodoxin-dependent (E)-4-hydroxy-3-methylbut-2-enyl-diphosphate synthase [Butyricicoccaceae bacterium]